MTRIEFAPSLVAAIADKLEAADVAYRAMTQQTVLPSMSDVSAVSVMNDFTEKMRRRFVSIARASGLDLNDYDRLSELYHAGYAEVDRRELDRAAAIKYRKRLAAERAAAQRELAEIEREERIYA